MRRMRSEILAKRDRKETCKACSKKKCKFRTDVCLTFVAMMYVDLSINLYEIGKKTLHTVHISSLSWSNTISTLKAKRKLGLMMMIASLLNKISYVKQSSQRSWGEVVRTKVFIGFSTDKTLILKNIFGNRNSFRVWPYLSSYGSFVQIWRPMNLKYSSLIHPFWISKR